MVSYQGASASFLLISPSTTMNGLGESGVSPTTSDIYSVYYNPAQVNLPSGVSFQYSSIEEEWLPGLANDMSIENKIKMIGYKSPYLGPHRISFQIAISELNTFFDLGEQVQTDEFGHLLGNFRSYMTSDARTFSLGLQFNKNIPISLSFGRTDKEIYQKIAPGGVVWPGGSWDGSSNDDAYDWGIRFSIDDYRIPHPRFNNIGLTYSMGYSKSNIGDWVSFNDFAQSDPLPRVARLGLTWGGKIYIFDDLGISFKSVHEAADMLIEVIDEEQRYQQGLLGDIDFKKHILDGDGDENVTIHKGVELNLFDIYYYRKGDLIDIGGSNVYNTEGYGINISNLIRLFQFAPINELLDYFDLSYNHSKTLAEQGEPKADTSFSELTLSFKKLYRLFYKLF